MNGEGVSEKGKRLSQWFGKSPISLGTRIDTPLFYIPLEMEMLFIINCKKYPNFEGAKTKTNVYLKINEIY